MTATLIQQLLFMISLKFVGGVFGYLLPTIDAVTYALYLHPERPESEAIKASWAKRDVRAMMQETHLLLQEPLPFIHRGIIFYAAFCAVSLFVLTSANSWLGAGLLIGFCLHMLLALLPYRTNLPALQERFFLGLAKHVSPAALYSLIGVLGGIFVWALVV
jgi:hypothetical protein